MQKQPPLSSPAADPHISPGRPQIITQMTFGHQASDLFQMLGACLPFPKSSKFRIPNTSQNLKNQISGSSDLSRFGDPLFHIVSVYFTIHRKLMFCNTYNEKCLPCNRFFLLLNFNKSLLLFLVSFSDTFSICFPTCCPQHDLGNQDRCKIRRHQLVSGFVKRENVESARICQYKRPDWIKHGIRNLSLEPGSRPKPNCVGFGANLFAEQKNIKKNKSCPSPYKSKKTCLK